MNDGTYSNLYTKYTPLAVVVSTADNMLVESLDTIKHKSACVLLYACRNFKDQLGVGRGVGRNVKKHDTITKVCEGDLRQQLLL